MWVRTVGHDDDRVVTDDTDRGIRQFFWGPDNRRILYLQDRGGDENWRLYDVDLATGDSRDLTPFEGVQTRVEHVDKDFPGRILVGLNRDQPELHDVYALELSRRRADEDRREPRFRRLRHRRVVRGAGCRGTARGRRPVRPRARRRRTRLGGRSSRRPGGCADHPSHWPSPRTVAASSLHLVGRRQHEPARLARLRRQAKTVVAEDPDYDVAGVRLHPDTNDPQIAFVRRERMDYLVLDPAVAGDLDRLRRLDRGDLGLAGHDDADRIWLAGFSTRRRPDPLPRLRPGVRAPTFLFEHQPALSRVRAGRHGAVLVHGTGRTRGPRLPDLPGRRASGRPCPPS